MAFIKEVQKETFISTFKLELMSPGDAAKKAEDDTGAGELVEFPDPKQKLVVKVGETAHLHCRFRSTGPVASCWIHDKQKVVCNSPRASVSSTSSSSSLVLSDVLPVDAGSYTLFVRNRRGVSHRTTTLIVITCPDPPSSCPSVSRLTQSSLVLCWSGPCFDGGSAITGYILEHQHLDGANPGVWTEFTKHCPNTSILLSSGLDPAGRYRFRVRACNAAGNSEPSKESDCIQMNTAGEPQQEVTSYIDVVPDTKHKARDHYHVHEKLGKGKFGEVFRMTHKQTGRVCAGKFYRARVSKDKMAARQEIKLMKELQHPKLVQCLAAYDSPSEIVMVMEYIAGGELFELIVAENFDHTEPNCANYMRQILEGIQYMHHKSIVHLDLKPENIVCVNATGTLIKIIDFGLACKLEPGKCLKVMQGTPEFVAPEVINYEPVDEGADILSGESPFQGNNDAETLALVTAGQWQFDPESFDDITDEAKEFIRGLLNKNKRKRLSCDKALAHPWIVSFDDANSRAIKSLNKDKIRRFLAKQKWKKTGKALLAVKRMARWMKSDGQVSPVSLNDHPLGDEAEQAVASLEKQLQSEPHFPQVLRDLTESSGATVHLACTIHGYPDPEVVWLFNEEPLEQTGRIQMNYEKNGVCTLTLAPVQPGDSGVYKCCASNGLGRAMCSARLSVKL
ncbi:hypothetical protein DNTS_013516 [Danionella cerebrum]|uniref:Myosin light chain kinase, smooth muscle-like n=1 Tax=Danionella cerebrum TaxID=2873325 RepID=A0A553QN31_9TELE|nr:hypothetical protein DNTS_013516 [Danionella translucida]